MTTTIAIARLMVARRRQRDKLFGADNFGEPGWDMLLDLYIAQADMRTISTSSLCVASGVPPTTALRWINKMEVDGWIERYRLPHDGRRTFVRLSTITQEKMEKLLSSWMVMTEDWTKNAHDRDSEVTNAKQNQSVN
jgi:DNA-binding MarR family transcriptional regulator